MQKKQKREKAVEFLNLGLTQDLAKRLTDYCLKRMTRNGKIRHGLKTKIARAALIEWLDKHEDDVNLEL